MTVVPEESPPLQVINWPAERFTVVDELALVQISGSGTLSVAVNGPTSAPPGPVTV